MFISSLALDPSNSSYCNTLFGHQILMIHRSSSSTHSSDHQVIVLSKWENAVNIAVLTNEVSPEDKDSMAILKIKQLHPKESFKQKTNSSFLFFQ